MTNLARRFPPELRTMSVVPRWSIVWTLTQDYLSNHSYFVTFYAREIALLIGWKGDLADLMYRALVHDVEETITGDICSPVKSGILDDEKAQDFIDTKMVDRLPFIVTDLEAMYEKSGHEEDVEAHAIIRAADKLDALIFLIVERRKGNGVIEPNLPRAMNSMEGCWRDLPAPKEHLDFLWNTVIVPAIDAHRNMGGFGI